MRRLLLSCLFLGSSLFAGAQNNNRMEELRSKETTDYVWVAAHRADYVFAPENSIQALKNAIYFGADLIETDVRLTKDSHVVMMHDYTVDRMTNGTTITCCNPTAVFQRNQNKGSVRQAQQVRKKKGFQK